MEPKQEPKQSVVGLSSLRAAEDKKAVPKSEKALQMEAYLKKYSDGDTKGGKEKKKKKKKREARMGTGVKLHDEDVRWQDAREPSPALSEEDGPVDDDEGTQPRFHCCDRWLNACGRSEHTACQQSNTSHLHQETVSESNLRAAPVVVNMEEAKHEIIMMQRAKKFGQTWSEVRHDSDDEVPARRPTDRQPRASAARARHDSDDDASPPRRGQTARHDSDDDDAAPPRRTQAAAAARHDSDNDVSPPRRAQAAARHDSDDDASPPRRAATGAAAAARHDSDSGDASPPRRGAASAAKQARNGGKGSDEDASPPRRPTAARADSDGDASPPRRGAQRRNSPGKSAGGGRQERSGAGKGSGRDLPPPPAKGAVGGVGTGKAFGSCMADGSSAGVVSASVLSAETAAKRAADKQRIMEMSAEQSGRGAAVVHRVDGRIVTKDEYAATHQQRADAKKRQPKFIEQEVEWKRGLAQQRAAEAEAAAQKRESGKKFHREFDDDADAAMRREVRADDPMAAYVSARQMDSGAHADLTDRHAAELVSSSGFVIPQVTPAHSWMRRRVQPTPNRFKIKPGRHWDGVHRSNGFEDFLFSHSNRRQADETELYVWAQDV